MNVLLLVAYNQGPARSISRDTAESIEWQQSQRGEKAWWFTTCKEVETLANSPSGNTCMCTCMDMYYIWLLQVPDGEDEALFARHNRALKAEQKKVKPNRTVVKELMNMSYEMRRNDILSQGKPLVQLLDDYPFLGHYDEVCAYACSKYDSVFIKIGPQTKSIMWFITCSCWLSLDVTKTTPKFKLTASKYGSSSGYPS